MNPPLLQTVNNMKKCAVKNDSAFFIARSYGSILKTAYKCGCISTTSPSAIEYTYVCTGGAPKMRSIAAM